MGSSKRKESNSDSHALLFKCVKFGDVDNMQVLLLDARLGVKDKSEQQQEVFPSDWIELRDKKHRCLLHIAAKFGQTSMINYLLEHGFKPDTLDRRGNNVASTFLKYCLKSREQRSARKRRRKSYESQIDYVLCCEILRNMLAFDQHILTTSNAQGQSPTVLLQRLWDQSSEEERSKGDEILMSSMSTISGKRVESSAFHSPTQWSQEDEATQDWIDDESSPFGAPNTEYAWEDYFSEFTEGTWRSHLDTVREEHDRKYRFHQPRQRPSTAAPPSTSSTPTSTYEKDRATFIKRHSEAMARRGVVKKEPVTWDSFQAKWKEFEKRDTPIQSLGDIPWPPFCERLDPSNLDDAAERRIEVVLQFVQNSLLSLRQLRIDWHPDRFENRYAVRLALECKDSVLQKVLAISQLLNTSMDILRKRQPHVT